MSNKNDYTPAEWELLQRSVLEAGAAMIALQTGGMVRESLAVFRVLDEARDNNPAGSLIFDLTNEDSEPYQSQETPAEPDDQSAYADNVRAMLDMLQQSIIVLQEKATAAELNQYRQLVLDVVENAARASRTGGFLGIGGKPINEAEAALIAEIQAQLQLSE